MRAANRQRVVDALRREGSLTQIEIAGTTGLSAASISTMVRELSDDGSVLLGPSIRNGRRATLVSLPGRDGVLGAVVIGERDVRVAVSAPSGQVQERIRMPLPYLHEPDETLNRVAHLIADLHAKIDRPLSDLRAVGVGLQAPVDTVSGQVGSESLLPRWSGISLMEALAEQIDAPVLLDNNANMAALGELRAGALQGVSNGCFVSVGYGVGAGLILGGALYRGSSGTAGEIGHLTLDENGAICTCGNRGCLDTFVGARSIVDAVRVSHGELRYLDVLSLAAKGDQGCRRVLADAGQHLGVAVSGLVNLFNPEVIALGGELGVAQEWVLGPMRAAIERHALPSAAATVRLLPSALGPEADLRGCFVAAEHGTPQSIEFKS